MSTNKNTTVARNGSKKTFCKVCFDAGKSEEVYNSHFVRTSPNPSAQVCCPTLLGQECRRCGKKGHTVSRCTVSIRDTTETRVIMPKVMVAAKVDVKNGFNALVDDSSESEDEMPAKRKTSRHFPSELQRSSYGKSQQCVELRPMHCLQVAPASTPAPAHAPRPINAWMDTAKREELTKSLLDALRVPKSAAAPVSSKMDDKMITLFRFKGTNGKSWADYDTDDDE
jgi:hypothetical protein